MVVENKIKVKAMCLLVHDGRVLVADGNTLKSSVRKVVESNFYRVLGGGMNFTETAEDCVRREIREELGSEIENLEQIDVVENIFTYAGEQGHEIVFLFKGALSRKELLAQDVIHIVEDTYEGDAVWVSVNEIINGNKPLYPATDYKRHLSTV